MAKRFVYFLFFLGLFSAQASSISRADDIIEADVVLVGSGIMSATLAALLKELSPDLKIIVLEKLDRVAAESSDTWNNAGTGHSALCELNYTSERADGSIDISKAVHTAEAFEISKQFWAYLVQRGYLGSPQRFIHSIPHISWVKGEKDVGFLKKRMAAMSNVGLFQGMEYSENPNDLKQWIPLIMQARSSSEIMAATRSSLGTDIDFGTLTRRLFEHLKRNRNTELLLSHDVRKLEHESDGKWTLKVNDTASGEAKDIRAKFVFIGAGGGTLPLLQKSGIREAQGYGGFPVSGQFLVSTNADLANLQNAKVYGKAAVGAPPMSVPHLDTRVINGKKVLIFGPFAGSTTRFLKEGSVLDLLRSIRMDNLGVMLKAGLQNIHLMEYLFRQTVQSHETRMKALREFIPNARSEDWKLVTAGQRVQVIKKGAKGEEVLKFGTEVVVSQDDTLAALLGASPGASTSVSVMLDLLERGFEKEFQSEEWQHKLREMIPSFGKHLADLPLLTFLIRKSSHKILGLSAPADCEEALAVAN